jgi:hypothetical protein
MYAEQSQMVPMAILLQCKYMSNVAGERVWLQTNLTYKIQP